MKNEILKHITLEEFQLQIVKNFEKIIENLLINVHDKEFFEEFCDFQFDMQKEVDMVNIEDFNLCMKYISSKFAFDRSKLFIRNLCENKMKTIENLFLICKKRIQETTIPEQQLLCLLQYFVMIHLLYDYLTSETHEHQVFLIRDIIYYVCNLISMNIGEYNT